MLPAFLVLFTSVGLGCSPCVQNHARLKICFFSEIQLICFISVSDLLSSNNGILLIKNSIGKIPLKIFPPINVSIVLPVYVHNDVT